MFNFGNKCIKVPENKICQYELLVNMMNDNYDVVNYNFELSDFDIKFLEKFILEDSLDTLISVNIMNIAGFFEYTGYREFKTIGNKYIRMYPKYHILSEEILKTFVTLYFYYECEIPDNIIKLIHDIKNITYDTSIGGFYILNRKSRAEPKFVKLHENKNILQFPKLTKLNCMTRRWNPVEKYKYPSISNKKANIYKNSIDLTKNIWLNNFPWYKFNNVCLAGYSLINMLSDEYDEILLYVYDSPHITIKRLLKHYNFLEYEVSMINPLEYLLCFENKKCRIVGMNVESAKELCWIFDTCIEQIFYDHTGLNVNSDACFELMSSYTTVRRGLSFNKRNILLNDGWSIMEHYKNFINLEAKYYDKIIPLPKNLGRLHENELPICQMIPLDIGNIRLLNDIDLVYLKKHLTNQYGARRLTFWNVEKRPCIPGKGKIEEFRYIPNFDKIKDISQIILRHMV